MNAKKYLICLLSILISLLIGWALLVVVIDPYFHFHAPLKGISYRLYEERYINDGIGRHFDYDAIITGTSMSQNFKTSEFDALFDKRSVKLPFSGAGFKELKENLERCLKRNPDCKTVLMSIDFNGLIRAWDWDQYGNQPTYLYDDNPFNDASYLWNKDVFYRGVLTNIVKTVKGEPSTTFDEYSSWDVPTGYEAIMNSGYKRREEIRPMNETYTEEDRGLLTGTEENIFIPLLEAHPDVEFYFFYTPYSVVSFDEMYREGRLKEMFMAEEEVTELLLSYPNVHLFCFLDDHELVENLDNYRDKEHYSAKVSSRILKQIAEGNHELTKENYREHVKETLEFFLHYDYDTIFVQ